MIKAIETSYKGYRFRSRLEARWAVCFDSLGIKWEYEVEGFDFGGRRYLPDFYLTEWKTWVEIKPDLPTPETLKAVENMILLKHEAIKKDGDNLISRNAYVICGSPGLTRLSIKDGKSWSIDDGYVILNPSAFYDDTPGMVTKAVPFLELKKRFIDHKNGNGRPISVSVAMESLAMVNGGKNLDVWPIYLTEIETNSSDMEAMVEDSQRTAWRSILQVVGDVNRVQITPTFPFGFMRRIYKGDGVKYDSNNLRISYNAARAARFEHGERPA